MFLFAQVHVRAAADGVEGDAVRGDAGVVWEEVPVAH